MPILQDGKKAVSIALFVCRQNRPVLLLIGLRCRHRCPGAGKWVENDDASRQQYAQRTSLRHGQLQQLGKHLERCRFVQHLSYPVRLITNDWKSSRSKHEASVHVHRLGWLHQRVSHLRAVASVAVSAAGCAAAGASWPPLHRLQLMLLS